ncbi:BnaCnng22300D [Brassica napus]|uniref:BnaCnng22300D protein n=1 Tax=Brassica napus TaxID=3708 RepID=A0A078IR08_BRANA|nr:BnaCnng22300D [Brassica napus]
MLSILCRPLSASVSWNPVRSFVLAFNSVSPIFQDLKVCDNRCLAVAELALPEDKGDSVLCYSNNHVLIQTYTRVVAVATHKGIGKMAKLVLLW